MRNPHTRSLSFFNLCVTGVNLFAIFFFLLYRRCSFTVVIRYYEYKHRMARVPVSTAITSQQLVLHAMVHACTPLQWVLN